LDGVVGRQVEDLAQLLLEQVAAVERPVGAGDVGQFGLLARGEVLRVLPEGESGTLEFAGGGLLAVVAGGVPDLAAQFVEGVGGPGDDVEGIETELAAACFGPRLVATRRLSTTALRLSAPPLHGLPESSLHRCRSLSARDRRPGPAVQAPRDLSGPQVPWMTLLQQPRVAATELSQFI
jgi:hypothetical protein